MKKKLPKGYTSWFDIYQECKEHMVDNNSQRIRKVIWENERQKVLYSITVGELKRLVFDELLLLLPSKEALLNTIDALHYQKYTTIKDPMLQNQMKCFLYKMKDLKLNKS